MHKSQILLFAAVIAVLVVRLYQKYLKKDKDKSRNESKSVSGSSFPSTSKDEDYEPYSKK
ncbi:MAG: hypothetical protein WA816_06545 [Bacteroidales bacterium]